MIHRATLLFLFWFGLPTVQAQQTLYDQTAVHSVYLQLPPDSLQVMLDQIVHERYMPAQFVYVAGNQRDTIAQVGLRLRGNTSLAAQKKSFKVSFNAFAPDQTYQGVKKLNLRGSHNDPSLIREKLWFDLAHRAGDPLRRTSFVRLYINGMYRGLYTNLEEVDKTWLKANFPDNDGNLYKCTWPADLDYHGPLQSTYTNILNSPTERAYDLATNEVANDYSDLIALMRILDYPVTSSGHDSIERVLDIESVLRGYALSIATGHWDDYFYNKNNYYLYRNPTDQRFTFFHFDTDNTMGVDWLNEDWTTREAFLWQRQDQPRPLATQLMKVPAYQQRWAVILDSITRHITHPDTMWRHMSTAHQLIRQAAFEDTFRQLDYGYSNQDFENSLTQNNLDGHTPWGIRPFFERRYISTLNQIEPFLTSSTSSVVETDLIIYPNPASHYFHVSSNQHRLESLELLDLAGRCLATAPAGQQTLHLNKILPGSYLLRITTTQGVVVKNVIVME